jgi:hypothetical protein
MRGLILNEIEAVRKIKEKRRRKIFSEKRTFVKSKSQKVLCGFKGCREEAITLKGRIPVCTRHEK